MFFVAVFKTLGGCNKHEKEKHPRIPNQFKCSICPGKAWNSSFLLRKHEKKWHKGRRSTAQLDQDKKDEMDLCETSVKIEQSVESAESAESVECGMRKRRGRKRTRLWLNGKIQCRYCDKG